MTQYKDTIIKNIFEEICLHVAIISTHSGNSPPATNLINESHFSVHGMFYSIYIKLGK